MAEIMIKANGNNYKSKLNKKNKTRTLFKNKEKIAIYNYVEKSLDLKDKSINQNIIFVFEDFCEVQREEIE